MSTTPQVRGPADADPAHMPPTRPHSPDNEHGHQGMHSPCDTYRCRGTHGPRDRRDHRRTRSPLGTGASA